MKELFSRPKLHSNELQDDRDHPIRPPEDEKKVSGLSANVSLISFSLPLAEQSRKRGSWRRPAQE